MFVATLNGVQHSNQYRIMTQDYKERKCGSCRGFMHWCKKRRSTNSCDKPACDRYEARRLEDFVIIGQPITGM